MAAEISPSVARARAASTASANRLFSIPNPPPEGEVAGRRPDGGVSPSPWGDTPPPAFGWSPSPCRGGFSYRHPRFNASSAAWHWLSSRCALTRMMRAICASRTLLLSTSSVSSRSSFASRYLLTPTITSSPRSTRACRAAAAVSIIALGQPAATALAMPPSASTRSMISCAASTSCWVSASI